jgi:SpoU rRNA methylase family enzyme
VIAKLDRPDLVVSNVQVKDLSTWGDTVTVSWTVTNQGAATALYDWTDSVYLSWDDKLDGWDHRILDQAVNDPTVMAAGASYTFTRDVRIPDGYDQTGRPYLLFVTDRDNTQPETNNSNNLKAIAPGFTYPDLVVTNASAPAHANWGGTIPGAWTVSNKGTVNARYDWTDSVYLSWDNKLDSGDALLSNLAVTDPTPMAAGASYSFTQNVNLPNWSDQRGTPYLLFVTDRSNSQPETNNDNNIKAIAILLDPAGTATSNASPLDDVLRVLNPKNLVNGLHLDDVVKVLNPDEVLKRLNPEEVLKRLNPDEVLKRLHLDEALNGLGPDKVLNELNLDEALKGLDPDKVLNGLHLDEALKGLDADELLEKLHELAAGFGDQVSFGLTTWLREKLYGEIATQNHSGALFNVGQLAGAATVVAAVATLAWAYGGASTAVGNWKLWASVHRLQPFYTKNG